MEYGMECKNIDQDLEKQRIRQSRYENTNWVHEENVFKNRWNILRPQLRDKAIPLKSVLDLIYRKSVFGVYLEEFNGSEKQDRFLNENKLEITLFDHQDYTEQDFEHFKKRNDDIIANSMWYLKDAVAYRDLINFEYFRKNLRCVRLNNCCIGELDDSLRDYKLLQIIHLNGNWIKRLYGNVFPRNLLILNLYGNKIERIDKGIQNLPKLSALGLGRNQLHDGSRLHLLAESTSLSSLRSLDLSNNEICDLKILLTFLSVLKHLCSLELEGNPCYVVPSYKDDVLKQIPKLLYLDNVEILSKDHEVSNEKNKTEHDPAIIFTCHRIMGLSAPPKQKGVVQTIHIEVSMPLLEEIVIPKEETVQVDPVVPEGTEKAKKKQKQKKNKKNKPDKSEKNSNKKGNNVKSSRKSGKSKKSNAAGLYGAEDEHENDIKSGVVNTAFVTERMPWSKVIQFPEDTLVINSQEASVTAIRDTFRTGVNVKVIYLKVEVPSKSKKKKKDKSSKKSSKKDSKKTKGKSSKTKKSTNSATKTSTSKVDQIPEEPKEVILKKVTLANFNCNLHHVNWSDKTIDFYWADHPDCKPDAISVEGSLRAINYDEPNKKGKKKSPPKSNVKSKKAASSVPSESQEKTNNILGAQSSPKIFTVQIGFGLKRSYNNVV